MGLLDSSNSLGLENIQRLFFGVPYPTAAAQIGSGPGSATVWLKCGLENNTNSRLNLSLYIGDLNYLDLFFVSVGRPLQQVRGGNLRRAVSGSSYVQRQSGSLPLRLEPHQGGELFVKIRQRTDEYYFSGIRIYDPHTLNESFVKDAESSNRSLIFQLLFQGFLICQLLPVCLFPVADHPEKGISILFPVPGRDRGILSEQTGTPIWRPAVVLPLSPAEGLPGQDPADPSLFPIFQVYPELPQHARELSQSE
jgi:hypothetical protein